MRLLVIGGTVFLGRHIVSLAMAAGHQVTTFNRGTHELAEQAGVEKLRGNREGDLSALSGRTFDAVIDTCGYNPDIVRHSSNFLSHAVGTYVFISTISVYGDFSQIGISEEHPTARTQPGEEGNYGSLKADCERVIAEVAPENSLIVRPGLIVGPYDPTDRFTYWPARFARGGQLIVPARLDRLVQFIDVRDLATWVIGIAERQERGIYNATGPDGRVSLGDFFEACDETVGSGRNCQLVKADDAVLEIAGVAPWTGLPLWLPATMTRFAGMMRIDRRKAVSAGLACRPMRDTIADTLEWDQARDPSIARLAGLSEEVERALLREPKLNPAPGKGPLPGAGLR